MGHLLQVLLVLGHVLLGRLHDLLLLDGQHLLKLRQLLYLLVYLYVHLVVFLRRDAWVAADHQVGYVFQVRRLDGVTVLLLA